MNAYQGQQSPGLPAAAVLGCLGTVVSIIHSSKAAADAVHCWPVACHHCMPVLHVSPRTCTAPNPSLLLLCVCYYSCILSIICLCGHVSNTCHRFVMMLLTNDDLFSHGMLTFHTVCRHCSLSVPGRWQRGHCNKERTQQNCLEMMPNCQLLCFCDILRCQHVRLYECTGVCLIVRHGVK